jgi:5-methylcytosine-specific restriction endonuclease McrA
MSCTCITCKTSVTLSCQNCREKFEVLSNKVKYRGQRFCSRKCANSFTAIVAKPLCKCGCGQKCSKQKNEYVERHHPILNRRGLKGSLNPNWQGGMPRRPHNSPEHIEFRKLVFKRDNFTCQDCGERGVKINAHHIVPVSVDISLIGELTNGVTLCHECHWARHRKMGFGKVRDLA